MRIRLCIGEYAKNGYEPERMGIKVYSIEELCYFITYFFTTLIHISIILSFFTKKVNQKFAVFSEFFD